MWGDWVVQMLPCGHLRERRTQPVCLDSPTALCQLQSLHVPTVELEVLGETNQDKPSMFSVVPATFREAVLSVIFVYQVAQIIELPQNKVILSPSQIQ